MKWIAGFGALLVCGVLLFFLSLRSLPPIDNIRGCFKTSMNQYYLCPDSPKYTALENISPYLKDAVVVSEDVSFFTHEGFDFHEIRKSFIDNIKRGRIFRGGSTITQQLAKNLYFSGEKTIRRKVREALIAKDIEEMLSKNEILEKYLNVVEFGDELYGIKSASEKYFFKSPEDLNILEALYLAHLLPSPKKYSENYAQGELSDYAQKRIRLNAKRLFQYGKINVIQYNAVKDLLRDFPWFSLTEAQRRRLRGDSILLDEEETTQGFTEDGEDLEELSE